MKLAYPNSIHCAQTDFPLLIEVRCGIMAPLPYSLGSKLVLTRTPIAGVPQGAYVDGEALPELYMSYSDNGLDEGYGLRLSFYSWATFYVANVDDEKCTLEVRHGVLYETENMAKRFEVYDTWETLIPSSEALGELFVPKPGIVRQGSSLPDDYPVVMIDGKLVTLTRSGIYSVDDGFTVVFLRVNGSLTEGKAYGGVTFVPGVFG